MGNTCSLCISSNKIHPIKIKKKFKKKSFKKKSNIKRKSKKSKYVIIPHEAINNIYSQTQI